MRKISVPLSFVTCLLLMSVPAFALDLGVVVGVDRDSPSFDSGNTALKTQFEKSNLHTESSTGLAGGLLFQQELFLFTLELGAIYAGHRFDVVSTSGSKETRASVSMNFVEFPLVLRYHFFPFLSLGGGPYYARSVGKLTSTTVSSSGSTSKSTETTYEDAHLSSSETGALASLQLKLGLIGTSMNVLGDLRYLHGFTDLNKDHGYNGDYTLKRRGWEFLAGIAFGI